MNIYILQKDLPDVKAGAEFKQGEVLDAYFLSSDKTETKYNCYSYPKDFVENNSEWFRSYPSDPYVVKAQEEFKKHPLGKPPLGLMPKYLHDEKRLEDIRNAMGRYTDVGKVAPQEWIDEQKELLEKIKFKMEVAAKKYTEKELLEAEEKAFNAAKEIVVVPIIENSKKWKEMQIRDENYKTFSDYKNGISQGTIMEEKIKDFLFKKS